MINFDKTALVLIDLQQGILKWIMRHIQLKMLFKMLTS